MTHNSSSMEEMLTIPGWASHGEWEMQMKQVRRLRTSERLILTCVKSWQVNEKGDTLHDKDSGCLIVRYFNHTLNHILCLGWELFKNATEKLEISLCLLMCTPEN